MRKKKLVTVLLVGGDASGVEVRVEPNKEHVDVPLKSVQPVGAYKVSEPTGETERYTIRRLWIDGETRYLAHPDDWTINDALDEITEAFVDNNKTSRKPAAGCRWIG